MTYPPHHHTPNTDNTGAPTLLPTPSTTCLAIIYRTSGEIHIAEHGESAHLHILRPNVGVTVHDTLIAWCRSRSKEKKYVACALIGFPDVPTLARRLWLEEDMVSFVETDVPPETYTPETLNERASTIASQFKDGILPVVHIGAHNIVTTPPLIDTPTHAFGTDSAWWQMLLQETEKFAGKRILFISATPQGGGVALMRHALMRLYHTIGVSATWCVMDDDAEAFLITKTKFHNILQGVTAEHTRITAHEREYYRGWAEKNVHRMAPEIDRADVIVIDDPQPSGMIPGIKALRPHAKLIFRSHIQLRSDLIDTPGTPQEEVWDFIWEHTQACDLFISHPIAHFVPKTVPSHKTVYMPPTTDPFDGLNKALTPDQQAFYLGLFNQILKENGQSPLDPHRPYVTQIARYDPSKGIPDVLVAMHELREKLTKDGWHDLPQLVIAGNSSVDDPDGTPIYTMIMEMLAVEPYRHMAHDVKVIRLPHIDQILNTILRNSAIALQLSHTEGYEIKVTEALMKGKPVLAYRAGGIPLQIQDRLNGFVLSDIGDTSAVAERLYELFTDTALYNRMSANATACARTDVLTVPNALNWLFLARYVLEHDNPRTADEAFVTGVRACATGLRTTPEL